jgi:D-alanyl-D-alanine carboxypeptidase
MLVAMLTVLAATASPLGAQDLEALRSKLQARLEELLATSTTPGVTAGVVLPDGRVIGLAAGLADTATKARMTPTSRLPSGSTGKTFVAAIALQMVSEGRIELDDPISTWFGGEPWFPRLPNGHAITLRMLMNHTSGIPDHVSERAFMRDVLAAPDRVWKPEELVSYILGDSAQFPAGTAFHYTDTNYILLGMIIERVTGSTYYAELRRRLLEPLQLRDIVPNDRKRITGVAQGYSGGLERSWLAYSGDSLEQAPRPGSAAAADAMLVDGAFVVNPQFEWTGGGLSTTAADLARWAKLVYEARAFPRALLDSALQGTPRGPARTYYGLGVSVSETADGPRYGHGGFFPGYSTTMAYFPRQRVAVAVQTNTTTSGVGNFSNRFVADALQMVVEALRR